MNLKEMQEYLDYLEENNPEEYSRLWHEILFNSLLLTVILLCFACLTHVLIQYIYSINIPVIYLMLSGYLGGVIINMIIGTSND